MVAMDQRLEAKVITCYKSQYNIAPFNAFNCNNGSKSKILPRKMSLIFVYTYICY